MPFTASENAYVALFPGGGLGVGVTTTASAPLGLAVAPMPMVPGCAPGCTGGVMPPGADIPEFMSLEHATSAVDAAIKTKRDERYMSVVSVLALWWAHSLAFPLGSGLDRRA